MPIPALWYGVIIGEMIYLGGEWYDKMRASKRANMRLEMEQARKNKEKRERRRQRQRERRKAAMDSQPVIPVYEEPESEDEHNDRSNYPPRRYIMDRSRSTHTARDRSLEYRTRHDDYSTHRSRSFNGASSISPNLERGLILSDGAPQDLRSRISSSQSYTNTGYSWARNDPRVNFANEQEDYHQTAEQSRNHSRRRNGHYP